MSGKPAARLTDLGSPHVCHVLPAPPTPLIAGSPNVLINFLPAGRQGDPYLPHCCPNCAPVLHPRFLAEGSPTVLFNNKPASRIGDKISCGGSHMIGSPNVLIGGNAPPGLTRSAFCESCEDAASSGG